MSGTISGSALLINGTAQIMDYNNVIASATIIRNVFNVLDRTLVGHGGVVDRTLVGHGGLWIEH